VIKDYFLFTTTSGNRYCFHRRRGTVLWCHPLLYHAITLHRAGQSADEWFASFHGDFVHLDDKLFARSDAELAQRRFLLLRQNGFFSETSEEEAVLSLSARLSASDIETALATTPQVVFELTERCNLRCDYCYFGYHYIQSGPRSDQDLDFATAKTLLDYLVRLSPAPPGSGPSRRLAVAFFGGEPLLPFSLLQQIVGYARSVFGERARFQIVTNGLLLPERWDLLVRNDFDLLISLDGDETCDAYRRFKDGTPSYEGVIRNVRALRERHPSYFERHVSFNAILTDRGSVNSVRNFFAEEFGKSPMISTLMERNLKPGDRASWTTMVGDASADGARADAPPEAARKMLVELSMPSMARRFLSQHAPCRFGNSLDALLPQPDVRMPTGVCRPFENKVFLTARGEILPCEQIDRCHALGRVSATAVDLDFDSVAAMYNRSFDRVRATCRSCLQAFDCLQCIFNLDLKQPRIECSLAPSEEEYSGWIVEVIDYLELNGSNISEDQGI